MFWRPAHEWRGTRTPWFTNAKLMNVEMSSLAARVVYRCFNLVPDLRAPTNDTDNLRW